MMLRQDDSQLRLELHGGAESATVWLVLGKTATNMTDTVDTLPYDIEALRALLVAERSAHIAERDKLAARNARLEEILAEIRRAHFGRKSDHVGLQLGGAAIVKGTNRAVRFIGKDSVTVPPGTSVWSDPVELAFVNDSAAAGRRRSPAR